MADAQNRRCKNCGKGFQLQQGKAGRRPRHCSSECRLDFQRNLAKGRWAAGIRTASQPLPRQPKPCQHCGEITRRPRYCSVRCSVTARDRRQGVPEKVYLQRRPCAVCGTMFKPKHNPNAGICCSRECGFTLIRWRGEQSSKVTQAKAEFARWANPSRILGFSIRLAKLRDKIAKRNRPCSLCGSDTNAADHRTRLCAECREMRSKAHKRAARLARKAKERAAIVERFDPLEVLGRDGWKCHLCGVSTPKRLRGTYDDRAPELDHIIALAAGGEHSRRNTACACRLCNIRKSDTPLGQLRLVA
jgi:hypothetical protein